jgi:hypothetical protein
MVEKNEVKQDGKDVSILGSEESLFHATGTRDKDLGTMLLNQTVSCSWEPTDTSGGANQAVAMIRTMEGISPRDVIEGMLTAQMLAVHNASMECMKRAMVPDQPSDFRNLNLNQATKLTRTFTTQMEALNRHRGKGQQKMTVEHVHVYEGGQAIVGPVTQGGGVDTKKEKQPHAKPITHAPGKALPSQDETEDVVPVASNAKRKM